MRLALSILVLGALLTGCASSQAPGAKPSHDDAPDRLGMARFANGKTLIASGDSLSPVLREVARPVALAETLPDTAGLGLPRFEVSVSRGVSAWREAEDGGPILPGVSMQIRDVARGSRGAPLLAELALFGVDRDGALEADRVLGARPVTVGALHGVVYPSRAALFGDSTFVLRVEAAWRLVARGTDLGLVRALVGRIEPAAVEATERVPTWIRAVPPSEAWRSPFFRGLLAREGEVLAVSGDPRPLCEGRRDRCPQQPSATLFRPPTGWTVSEQPPEGESPPIGTHIATLRSESAPTATSSLTVSVQASGGAVTAPLDWLVEWEGFAASKLPWWTTDLEPGDAPERRTFGSQDGVRLALRQEIGGAPRHVEAGLVPVGDWLLLVLGTGHPDDAAALRAAVADLAATLRVRDL